ncbi:MAG TPA: ABC transporter permease [Acidimicrobiales bacterium]|nr:ABC transporter permease [Acidimicrobiales bacterium]
MTWGAYVRGAFGAFGANKLRSGLTMLGILIGVSAVVILVAVGTGSSAAVQARIKALGTNTITILGTGRFGRGPATTGTQTQAATLTAADVAQMTDPTIAPDIATASPVVSASVTATVGDATSTATLTGSTPTYTGAEDFTVAAGRGLTAADVAGHGDVALLGSTLVSDLYQPGADPIGTTVSLDGVPVQVVGVLAAKGATGAADPNAVAITPYTFAQDHLTGYAASFTEVIVQSKSAADIDAAEGEAASILAAANDTTVTALPFNFLNEGSLLATSQSTTHTFTVLLGAVAAISLLVGGINIMNIMLVTVTERTREIGIRKAIGAPRSAIIGQFLTEAVILSMLGGLAGVVVGLIGSHFTIVGVKPVVSWPSIVEAAGVAVAVGVCFGLYPANRAAAMRPIDALRYE